MVLVLSIKRMRTKLPRHGFSAEARWFGRQAGGMSGLAVTSGRDERRRFRDERRAVQR